jgi:hypothetical protein
VENAEQSQGARIVQKFPSYYKTLGVSEGALLRVAEGLYIGTFEARDIFVMSPSRRGKNLFSFRKCFS